jgi:ubiquinone/menaquinone biosynthesis C-methylase UbiE
MAYDDVAELYDDVPAPLFRRLARDVVGAVDLAAAGVVVDVGTGSGFAAGAAMREMRDGVVVGVEPSLPMLRRAQSRLTYALVGIAPGLPFRAACFDAAVANLVLSHFAALDEGLRDIARVVRPGGRFAASAWSQLPGRPMMTMAPRPAP